MLSLVFVLVMTGQGPVQAAGTGMSAGEPVGTFDPVEAPPAHDHHRSHGHDVPAGADARSDATGGGGAHHAGHADGSGCCPASVCSSACGGLCSGSGVGVPAMVAAVTRLSGRPLIVGATTDDPVRTRALGVPFRPPIARPLAASEFACRIGPIAAGV